jgi:glycosyltransferase involved in cell wall biosynthesis
MRVVLATTAPQAGGVSRHLFDLADGFEHRGYEVAVASRADASGLIAAARGRGLPWVSLRQSLAADADIWHLHLHNTLDTRALPLMGARRLRAAGAIVMTEHLPRVPRTDPAFPTNTGSSPGVRKPGAAQLKPLLKRAEYTIADAVITVSRSSAEFVARRWRPRRARLTTIHNGVAVTHDPPPPPPGTDVRVVGIAALHWLKGFDVLLEAAALAKEPWSVSLVGDGVERPRLEQQARALATTHRVEFAGWREDAARAALDADIVCAPSRAESFSYVVLEAMACARPLVAAAVDGAGEAIADGETGTLVPPDDPAALAEALDALARDRQLRERMGNAAHVRVRAHFELSQMIDATVDLYERLVARR